MNFNHLVTDHNLKRVCHAEGHKECYYQPTGDGRTTTGGSAFIQLMCRNCRRRQDVILTEEQFKQHKRVIKNEISKL